MLETIAPPPESGGKEERARLGAALAALQQAARKKGLPAVILFEGWGASGKGRTISALIQNLDPRGCRVFAYEAAAESERRKPVLWRYWRDLPAKGQIAVLDRSWYRDVSTARVEEGIESGENVRRMNEINTLERQLTDAGYLIVKFFLQISKKEQKRRFEKLQKDPARAWRVTEQDLMRNRKYDRYFRAFDEMLGYTDTAYARWHAVDAEDRERAEAEVMRTVVRRLGEALAAVPEPESPVGNPAGPFHLLPAPVLAETELDRKIKDDAYRRELKREQDSLSELSETLYRRRIPAVVVFEGWDAAGKGGCIRRMTKALDPRGFHVAPVAAPDAEEISRHYLWRFWRELPEDGHITVYDRSWYGRVLVERVEGLCTEEERRRAYREINEFERALCSWGAVVIKYWMQIDREEQLRRFTERQDTPEKQWKLTDEDWRNRQKWDEYETAANDMLRYTSTDFAPWHVVASQDKKYARVQTLKILEEALRRRLSYPSDG